MKTLQMISIVLLVPLAMAGYFARSLWTSILAILAGMGMISAQGDVKPNDRVTFETVKHYKQVPLKQSLMQDACWADSNLLNKWAEAERNVIKCLLLGDEGYRELEDWVKAANKAAETAQNAVPQGLLSGEAYGMARQILDEWHCDVVTSYGGVKCYDRAATPPVVGNVANRLATLAQYKKEGKLSVQVVAEAEAGMEADLKGVESAAIADEVTSFLLDLLGYS
jgi:hypothetical protein